MDRNDRPILGLALAAVFLALAGCGTGNRLDVLDDDAYLGGFFLPPVQKSELRLESELIGGKYEGGGLDLTFPADVSTTSGAAFTLPDQASVHSDEQIYDYDGNGVIDYIVLTIRALSAQAQANVTVQTTDGQGNTTRTNPGNFFKVGGASFEPHEATFSPSIIIYLPLDGSAAASPGDHLAVYRFISDFHTVSDDIGTGSGAWEFVGNGTVDPGGISVSIAVKKFGQYCVSVEEVVHNQGSGGDI